MKKILFTCFVLFNLSILSSQTIESGSHNTTAYIKNEGTIEDAWSMEQYNKEI